MNTCGLLTIPLLVSSGQSMHTPPTIHALQVLSESKPEIRWDKKSGLIADLDCDGSPDHAFLGRSGGRVYVGMVRASGQKVEILGFAVSRSEQAAICEEPGKLKIESLDYDPSDAGGKIDGFARSRTCKGLRLSGGDCDSIHIFWNRKTRHFGWWRL